MSDQDQNNKSPISRRSLLGTVTAVTATGFAGCGGNGGATPTDGDGGGGDGDGGDGDGDGDQQLGERVPTFVAAYFATSGDRTAAMEDFLPGLKQDWEKLGFSVRVDPVDTGALVGQVTQDQRTAHAALWGFITGPFSLDQSDFLLRYRGDWAGNDGNHNSANYINCDYTDAIIGQASASTPEQRQELTNEAQKVMTEDFAVAPVLRDLRFTAANQSVNVKNAGKLGLFVENLEAYATSEPSGDTLVASKDPSRGGTRNFLMTINSSSLGAWTYLVHSPLFYIDQNYQRQPGLADSIDVSEDGTTVTIRLKDGIQFHNGDPVTSEDVKFTFEHVNNNTETYFQAQSWPYESINAVDDRTIEFNFETPSLGWLNFSLIKWGILHKESWVDGGVQENPEEFSYEPDMPGSGPFEVNDYQVNSHINLNPAGMDHPLFNPDHQVTFQVFSEAQSAVQAFRQGNIDILNLLPASSAFDLLDNDDFEVFTTDGVSTFVFQLQYPSAPVKFREFRHAFGAAMNRKRANDIAFNGRNAPVLFPLPTNQNAPWAAPEDMLTKFTDDPEGDIEAARQILADAGWGWDDNGNLRYPADADLDPLWPKGEEPDPDDFPCLGPEGEYLPPDER